MSEASGVAIAASGAERDAANIGRMPGGPSRLGRIALGAVLLAPLATEFALRAATPDQMLAVGGLYLVAVLLFAALAPRSAPPPDALADDEAPAVRPRWALVGLAGLLLAVELYLATRDIRSWTLLPLWLAGIALWVLAWAPRPRLPRLSRPQLILLGGLLLIAAAARLYDLEHVQLVQGDEFVLTHIALRRAWASVVDPSTGFPVFDMHDNDGNSQLVLGSYRRLLSFYLFGITFTGLRLPSALSGLLEVGLVFFLGRQLFGFRVGLAAAAVLTPLTVHLAFSRHGDDNIEGSFVWTLTALLLARGVARRSPPLLALAGGSLSLALYLYLSARPAVVFVLFFLVMAALDPRLRGRWLAWGSLALIGGFLVCSGPVLVTYYKQPSIFFYNAQVTSWLGTAIAKFRASGNIADLLPVWDHFSRALMAYNVVPSADHHYWPKRGLFTWLPAALLYGALGLVCLRLKDWRYRMLALWFWGPTIGLSMLSDFPPPVHRLLPVLPACALLIGLAFDRIVAAWEGVAPWARRAAAPVAALGLTLALVHEGAFYFGEYAQRDLEPWENALSRYILTLPPGEQVGVIQGSRSMVLPMYFATNLGRNHPYEFFGRAVDELPSASGWASAVRTDKVVYDNVGERPLPAPTTPPPGITYMVHSERLEWLSVLEEVYPNGRETRLYSADPHLADEITHHQPVKDPLMWVAYHVDADQVAALGGLRLIARDARGETVEMPASSISLPRPLPSSLAYPVDLEWRGWFHSDPIDEEPFTLYSAGSVVPTLRLADQTIDLASGSARAKPPPGGQPLRATARLNAPTDTVLVEWDGLQRKTRQPLGAGQSTVWPGEPRLTVDWLTRDGGRLLRRDYDVMIADWNLQFRHPTPDPVLIRWTGQLQIDRPVTREFELGGDGPVRLLIDGKQLWPGASGQTERPGGPPETRRARVRLEPGRHQLVLERVKTEGSQVVLFWREGDEPFVVVPKDAFAPLAWP